VIEDTIAEAGDISLCKAKLIADALKETYDIIERSQGEEI